MIATAIFLINNYNSVSDSIKNMGFTCNLYNYAEFWSVMVKEGADMVEIARSAGINASLDKKHEAVYVNRHGYNQRLQA